MCQLCKETLNVTKLQFFCYFLASYYCGDQHKFPGSECQKQAQKQIIVDVESMLCPLNCVAIFHGFYMNCQSVSFIITSKIWLSCLIWLTTIHKSLFCLMTWRWFTERNFRNVGCNVHNVKFQVPLQNCECQLKWNQPFWVTQPLNCIYLEKFIQNPLILQRNFE